MIHLRSLWPLYSYIANSMIFCRLHLAFGVAAVDFLLVPLFLFVVAITITFTTIIIIFVTLGIYLIVPQCFRVYVDSLLLYPSFDFHAKLAAML